MKDFNDVLERLNAHVLHAEGGEVVIGSTDDERDELEEIEAIRAISAEIREPAPTTFTSSHIESEVTISYLDGD